MKCNTLFVPKKLSPQKGNELKLPWPKPDVIITIKKLAKYVTRLRKKSKENFSAFMSGAIWFGNEVSVGFIYNDGSIHTK